MMGGYQCAKEEIAQGQVLEVPKDNRYMVHQHPHELDGPDFQRMAYSCVKHLENMPYTIPVSVITWHTFHCLSFTEALSEGQR